MIEDVIAEIEGALEEATIEERILSTVGCAQAHARIKSVQLLLDDALRAANKAKEVLSK